MVPKRQLLRKINAFATSSLGDMHQQLDPFYSVIGRPSIDSELLNRMPIVGYCFGIRFGTGGWVSARWLLSKSIESQGRLVTKHRVSHRKLPMRCACNAEFRPGGKGRNSRRLQLGIADRLRESHKPRRQQLPRLGETRAVRGAAEHRDQPLRGLVQIHVLADEPRIGIRSQAFLLRRGAVQPVAVGDVDQIDRRGANEILHASLRADVLSHGLRQLVRVGVVAPRAIRRRHIDLALDGVPL
jgi:hypothetical protein